MKPEAVAEKLIAAANKHEIERILNSSKEVSEVKLAYALKEKCYSNWVSEPTLAQKAAAALTALKGGSSEEEVSAVSDWVNGIAEITKGRLELSLEFFTSADEQFRHLGKPLESARTKVAKMIPLGLLGEYDQASRVGAEALSVFIAEDDEVAAGKIEMNLSNISSRQGRNLEAKEFSASALGRFRAANETSWQVMAENDLAHTLAELNDFKTAEIHYAAALSTARSERMLLTEAEILASLGNLQTLRGNYGEALNHLELSRQIFEKLKMPHQTAIADLETAEIYQTLNLTKEAATLYEELNSQLRSFKMRGEEARSRSNYGKLSIETKAFEKARFELETALSLFRKEENPSGTAKVELLIARLDSSLGEFGKALAGANAALESIDAAELPRLRLEALFMKGDLLRELNRAEEARTVLSDCVSAAAEFEQHSLEALALVALAQIDIEERAPDNAFAKLKRAVTIVEELRAPIPAEEFRMTFLADKLAPFKMLSRLSVDSGEIEEAFLWTERARSRTLLEAVDSNQNEGNINEHKDPKYRELREQLNWYYSRISDDKQNHEQNKLEISRLEKELAAIGLRQSSLSNPLHSTDKSQDWTGFLENLIQMLGEDRALVEFTVEDDAISAFFVNAEGVTYFENIARESDVLKLLEGLRFQFESLRFDGDSLSEHEQQMKGRADKYLERLYEYLIAPFEELVKTVNLIIVPVASLFYVPFNALFDGERYLVEERNITLAPSAAIWQNSGSERLEKIESALILAFADAHIPFSEHEAEAVERSFPNTLLLTGKKATVRNYFDNSAQHDVIHFACHGEFRPDNPMYSNLRLADGFITVGDISRQELKAQLVTLSACETGLNEVFAGEEILGLSRGFLSAGAQNIVMTLWSVSDDATAELMSLFYEQVTAGATIASALRHSQRSFIKKNKHPYYWSSFVIIGK